MKIFNASKIENGKIYYFGKPVGIVYDNRIAVVPEKYYCGELRSFLEESGLKVCWVQYVPEELKRAV